MKEISMELKPDIVKTQTVELRDIDVQCGVGQGLSLTLDLAIASQTLSRSAAGIFKSCTPQESRVGSTVSWSS
jgi:hypothetical protein